MSVTDKVFKDRYNKMKKDYAFFKSTGERIYLNEVWISIMLNVRDLGMKNTEAIKKYVEMAFNDCEKAYLDVVV